MRRTVGHAEDRAECRALLHVREVGSSATGGSGVGDWGLTMVVVVLSPGRPSSPWSLLLSVCFCVWAGRADGAGTGRVDVDCAIHVQWTVALRWPECGDRVACGSSRCSRLGDALTADAFALAGAMRGPGRGLWFCRGDNYLSTAALICLRDLWVFCPAPAGYGLAVGITICPLARGASERSAAAFCRCAHCALLGEVDLSAPPSCSVLFLRNNSPDVDDCSGSLRLWIGGLRCAGAVRWDRWDGMDGDEAVVRPRCRGGRSGLAGWSIGHAREWAQ